MQQGQASRVWDFRYQQNENYIIEKLVLIHGTREGVYLGFQSDADPICCSNNVELH
jgi:hypothetical protein